MTKQAAGTSKTTRVQTHFIICGRKKWRKIQESIELEIASHPKTLWEHVRKQQAIFKKISKVLADICSGGFHTMTSRSVLNLVKATGVGKFRGRVILEVGCGVGNICNHLLELGASFVIGIDLKEPWDILSHVPQVLKDRPDTEFIYQDFLELQSIRSDVSIITMFIGMPPLVKHLFNLFVASKHVKIIIFMIPVYSDDRARMYCDIDRLFPKDEFVVSEKVKIQLEFGQTTRYCLVIHRSKPRKMKQQDTAESSIV
jgi:hypothetical protein